MASRNRSRKKSIPPRDALRPGTPLLTLTAAGARDVIRSVIDDLLNAAGDVCEQQDPLEAEFFGAGLRATLCEMWRVITEDPDPTIGSALVRAAENAGSAKALALLLAVDATWPDPVSSRARSAADRLRRRGVHPPPWADSVRRVRLERTSIAEDPYGDAAVLMATFSYGGQQPHCALALVDRNLGCMVKDAFVGEEPELAGIDARPAGLTFGPIDLAEAASILAVGLERRRTAGPDVSDAIATSIDDLVVLCLLEARLRAFPRPARNGQLSRPSPLASERLVADFMASPELERLSAHPEHVEFVAWQMVEFKTGYVDGDPLRWSPLVVDCFMRDWFPRKITADVESVDCLPEVLRRWVRWAGRRRGLGPNLIEETVAAVDGSVRAFRNACRDRSRFAPAKAVATAMREDGVDVRDPAAVDEWVGQFQTCSSKEREAKLGQQLELVGVLAEHGRLHVAVGLPPL